MKTLGLILILLGVVYAIAFVPVLFLGDDFPTAGLMAPVVCGSGYDLRSETSVTETSRRTIVGTSLQCVKGDEVKDAPLLLILAFVPGVVIAVVGISLRNVGQAFQNMGGGTGGTGGYAEMRRIARQPEVKAQLDALIKELKAGRITTAEYTTRMNAIIAAHTPKTE